MSTIRLTGKWSFALFVSTFVLVAGVHGQGQRTEHVHGKPFVTLSPNPVNFPAVSLGAGSAPVLVTVTNVANSTLNISSVAAGGSNPSDFTDTNGCSAPVPPLGTCTISVTFVPTASGPRSETITLTDHRPNSPQVISVSGIANSIAITLAPQTSAIGASQSLQFSASGDPAGVTWSLSASTDSGLGTAAPAGTIDATGLYTPPAGSPSLLVAVTATSKTDPTKSASASINVVAPGAFANTNNVQVAQYTVSTAAPAKVSVQFGLDTSYGLNTWTQPTPTLGGPVSLYVAGMKQSTPYHMRGVIQFADGTTFDDSDFTFTTGALQASQLPAITASTTPGLTPQSGVEVLDMITLAASASQNGPVVTDLNGNVLWTYNAGLSGVFADPVKLLPNGHLMINYNGGTPDGVNSVLQEVDLGGNLIWQMTAAQLNSALAAATCTGCNITVTGTHHDFAVLPNGHLIVIAGTQQLISGTNVTGDVLIDLDQNHKPVWLWSEFDHLDTNRRPYLYPDWTHTNAVLYSPDDGNLIISIRHQNWLVKIDYNNGSGTGDVLWRLGYQGDFVLMNADGTADPNSEDWFFAQHGPSFTTANTTGNFGLTVFDNGDDRGVVDVAGGTCGVTGQPSCFSTVPILSVDESAKTATFLFHQKTPDYSFFGGNADVLKNGNVEFCESAGGPGTAGDVYELTQDSPPQTVWHTLASGEFAYRGQRIDSLYPGVQW